jgi:hypothetical protein
MAGDWIKMRSNLWDDPRVTRLCDITENTEAAIIGGLYWLWATADQHTEDGHLPGLSVAGIDRKTDIKGFGTALLEIGWISDTQGGVTIARFDEHNGSSAKRRCTEAQRKANSRKLSAFDADTSRTGSGQTPPSCGAREREREREREESKPTTPYGVVAGNDVANSEPSPTDGGNLSSVVARCKATAPDCPHQDIIKLYHEILPMGTQVRVWNGARAKQLQARWRENQKRQTLNWWRRFFKHVADSEFLTGRTQPAQGRQPFVVSLDWIVAPQNFAKVIEGKYHREAA